MFRRSRRVAGRKYPKRKSAGRRVAKKQASKRRTNTIKLVRKGITAHVYNNSAGTDFATNSNWLTLGTKSAVASALPNYYNLPFSAAFRMTDLYNFTEFLNISEKCKLDYVKIYAYVTSTTASVNGLGQMPTLLWDDKGVEDDVPPTYSAFKEQMGIKRMFLSQGKTAVIKPKLVCNAPVYSGISNLLVPSVKPPQWLNTDSNSAATEHYGFNGVIEDFLLTTQAQAVIDIKFDIEMGFSLRDVK